MNKDFPYLYFYDKTENYTSLTTDKLILQSLEGLSCKCPYITENVNINNVTVLRTSKGKPYLSGLEDKIYLGVTHTDKTVIIAFWQKNFGIDAENLSRMVKNPLLIANKYFSDKELAYLNLSDFSAENIHKRFLEIWVKKEAYVKYLGTGLCDLSKADTFAINGKFIDMSDNDNIIYIYSPV